MKKKIFVCDDNNTVLLFVRKILKDDYDVLCCNDSREALGMILKFKPDLLLLDIMMPQVDGIQLCKETLSFLGENVPIIFLSANKYTEQIKAAYDAGGFDYIVKSGDSYEVKCKVREALDVAEHKDISCRKKLNELSSMVNRFLKTIVNY